MSCFPSRFQCHSFISGFHPKSRVSPKPILAGGHGKQATSFPSERIPREPPVNGLSRRISSTWLRYSTLPLTAAPRRFQAREKPRFKPGLYHLIYLNAAARLFPCGEPDLYRCHGLPPCKPRIPALTRPAVQHVLLQVPWHMTGRWAGTLR